MTSASARLLAVASGVLLCTLAPRAESASRYDENLFDAMTWRSIGPYRGGRVTTVAGAAAQPFTFYFGCGFHFFIRARPH